MVAAAATVEMEVASADTVAMVEAVATVEAVAMVEAVATVAAVVTVAVAAVAVVAVATTMVHNNVNPATTVTATPASDLKSNKVSVTTLAPRTTTKSEECPTFASLQKYAGSAKTTRLSEETCAKRSIESASRPQ